LYWIRQHNLLTDQGSEIDDHTVVNIQIRFICGTRTTLWILNYIGGCRGKKYDPCVNTKIGVHSFQAATTRDGYNTKDPTLEEQLLCYLCQPTPHVHGFRDDCIRSLGQLHRSWSNRYLQQQSNFRDGCDPHD
jgi:hypothetical protein